MKITVTQLPSSLELLNPAWEELVSDVKQNQPDIVLLPEMIFSPWLAASKQVDPSEWQVAIDSHLEWIAKFDELSPAMILGSRPILDNGIPYNESFVWDTKNGLKPTHRKHYLPNEAGFWEAEWYRPAPIDFSAMQTNQAKIGFMICTDLWYTEHARKYGREGVQILANPRATEKSTGEKWLIGGKSAAIMSGAYCISSNHSGKSGDVEFGGMGWVIDPNGNILEITSNENPFVTINIELTLADKAKSTYPRDILE